MFRQTRKTKKVTRDKSIHFRAPAKLYDKALAIAVAQDRTLSSISRIALADYAEGYLTKHSRREVKGNDNR